MSNHNVVIDADTGNILPSSPQNNTALTGIKTNVSNDNSIIAKILGKDDAINQEIAKINSQVAIISAIEKGNAEIATVIENQKQQLLLDIKRIHNSFGEIMPELQKKAMLIRASKLNETAVLYREICEKIKQENHEKEIEDELLAMAREDWMSKNSTIKNIFSDNPQRDSNIALH